MVSNDQQYPQPVGPAGAPQPPVMNNAPGSGYFANNPLQGPMAPPQAQMSGAAYMPGATPVGSQQQPAPPPVPSMVAPSNAPAMPNAGNFSPVAGVPQTPSVAGAGQQASTNDDATDVDDVEWVNRAKRVIAGTQGDPHRQVQLVQHLRSQYLKQRFGRTVHTDER